MKKLFVFIAIVLLIGAVAFADTPGYRQSPGTGDIMGQGKYVSDPHRTFRLVRYVQTTYTSSEITGYNLTGLTADALVIWHTVSEDDGVTVTETTVTCDSRVAGVLATNALTQETPGNTVSDDVGLQNWCYIQTYGKCYVNQGSASSTAGDALGTAATPTCAMSFVGGSISSGSGGANLSANYGNAGFYMNSATVSQGKVRAFVRLE